ncbi:MAG: carotenoid oxygenase family protein [Pseudomonadota bacterium]|nr:carotenoid oxygenase family protein [Pseudomonadota bacterium]
MIRLAGNLRAEHHGDSGKTFLAIFEVADVAAGPVAKLWLRHHVPVSFHGWWRAA